MTAHRRVVRSGAGLALAGLLLAGCGSTGSPPDPSDAATPSPTDGPATATSAPSASAGPSSPGPDGAAPADPPGGAEAPAAPSGGPGAPTVGVTRLPAVPQGRDAAFGDGLVASATGFEAVTIDARGSGEVAGPGVAVRLTLRNEGREPLDLGGVAVTAAYGSGTPAGPSSGDPAAPVSGTLRPGRTARGTYVFGVPPDQADSLVVDVGFSGSRAVAVIRR